MARKNSNSSEGKQNIITALLSECDIKTEEDIQEALKDLLGGTIQSMLEAELDNHLGYEQYECSDSTNARNGKKEKTVRSTYGEMKLQVPQDRGRTFEPQIVKSVRKR